MQRIHSYGLLTMFMYMCMLPAYAQDPQYSQYYGNPLYLCPAFAGAEENTRAIVATRYQWPGLDASYISNTVSVDHYVEKYKSGIGAIVNSDFSTAAKIHSTEAGAIYAFQAELSNKLVFRPALQLSYVSRSLDFDKLTFGSQYTNDGFQGGHTNEFPSSTTIGYADVSTGGLLYAKQWWIGVSAHHLNRPDQSIIKDQSRLPVKETLFGGYTISLNPVWQREHLNPNEEKSITPTFMYKAQGKSDQLDIGVYGRYNYLLVGLWYRGIPVKIYKGETSNQDAFVVLVGFYYNNFRMGYSYDYTLSRLTNGRSGGSHELTLSYALKTKPSKRIQKRARCPKFM